MTTNKKRATYRTIHHPRIRGIVPNPKIQLPAPQIPHSDAMGTYERLFDEEGQKPKDDKTTMQVSVRPAAGASRAIGT